MVTPHQLRHSCATLLLNAGAPILTVQAILGHKHVDTTLRYARLYDATVSSDYYRAMGEVERRMELCVGEREDAQDGSRVVELVDSLSAGPLNRHQRVRLSALREAIQTLVQAEAYTA
jgi:hypothetical protein